MYIIIIVITVIVIPNTKPRSVGRSGGAEERRVSDGGGNWRGCQLLRAGRTGHKVQMPAPPDR